MDIKQTSEHLKLLGNPFDVIIVKDGHERTVYPNCSPTDVETLLKGTVEKFNPDQLIIQERQKNGNALLKKEKYPINLGGLNNAAPVHTPAPMQQHTAPSTFLEYLNKELEKKNDKLEKTVDKLEAENEKLKRENFELEKENKYKDKEFELSKKEADMEKAGGLNGIMETVGSNPALANLATMAIGRLMGVEVPPVGAIEGSEGDVTSSQSTGTTQEQIGDHIKNWLTKLDEGLATKFFEMTNILAQDPTQIDVVLTSLKNEDE